MGTKAAKRTIGGVIPPMLTAFTKSGEVYEKGVRNTVEFLSTRANGLFICGTYGSGLIMTPAQRKQVAEICVDQAAGRIPIIVQVGCADTETAVELAKHAEQVGADAVASIAPYYYTYTQPELRGYYMALIDAVDIPVYAYNNPKTSGNPLSPKLIKDLADHGLTGLKDSSFDILNFYKFSEAVKDSNFNLIVGTEGIMFPAMMCGARGVVSGVANVFPEKVRELYDAVLAHEYDRANELQVVVLALRDAIKLGPTVPICHEVLKLRGIDGGTVRSPFLPAGDEVMAKVKKALADLGMM